MSHLLALLFEYQRYQRDAIMRVYADDSLVDEITLTHDIKLKNRKYIARPPFPDANKEGNPLMPEKLFLYEIDKKHLTKSIRIEVVNDNNNYNNGFMNKFSYICFYALFIVPKCLLYQVNWTRLSRFVNAKWETSDPNRKPSEFNFFPYRHPRPSDIILRSCTNSWGDKDLCETQRGGSFDIEIPLYWKHGQVHITPPKPGRMDLHDYALKVLSVFNVLNTNNEDQRSNHT